MKRTERSNSTSSSRSSSQSGAPTTNKAGRPAIVQYLDEQGNPSGPPIKMFLPDRSRSSRIISSSHSSSDARSIKSCNISMSSSSSSRSQSRLQSRQSSQSSASQPLSIARPAHDVSKSIAPLQEVRPADLKPWWTIEIPGDLDWAISWHKLKRDDCDLCENSASRPVNQSSGQSSRIARRPSVQALIAAQHKSGFPRPKCMHDELTLEDGSELARDQCANITKSYIPRRTLQGELVWVDKPNNTRKWIE